MDTFYGPSQYLFQQGTVIVHVEQGNYVSVNENHVHMERQATILIKLAYFACSAILGENYSKLEV